MRRQPLEAEAEGFGGKARKIKRDLLWLVSIPSWMCVCRGVMKPHLSPGRCPWSMARVVFFSGVITDKLLMFL